MTFIYSGILLFFFGAWIVAQFGNPESAKDPTLMNTFDQLGAYIIILSALITVGGSVYKLVEPLL